MPGSSCTSGLHALMLPRRRSEEVGAVLCPSRGEAALSNRSRPLPESSEIIGSALYPVVLLQRSHESGRRCVEDGKQAHGAS